MEYCDAPETHDVQCWIEVLMGLTKFAQADLAALDAMPSELAAFDPAATPPAWAAAVGVSAPPSTPMHRVSLSSFLAVQQALFIM